MTCSSLTSLFICLSIVVVVNFSKHWLMCMCRLAVCVSAIYVLQKCGVCVCVYRANGTENHPNCLARQAVAYFRFTFFLHCQGIAILSLMIFCSSFVVYVACGDGCDGDGSTVACESVRDKRHKTTYTRSRTLSHFLLLSSKRKR